MSLLGKCYYRIAGTRVGHRAACEGLRVARHFGAFREFHTPLAGTEMPYRAARELMRLWQRVHWSSGDGMMTPEERLAIFNLACSCSASGDIAELGCWKGLTTCYLAAACRARGRGRVFAVDTFAGTREHDTQYASIDRHGGSTLPAFRNFMERGGFEDIVTACVGLTTEVAPRHRTRSFAFVLIDADHSYDGVRDDFEAWSPMVAPGGLVVFHDYAMPDAGVRDYVQREVITRPDFEAAPGEILPNVFAVTRRQ